MTEQGEFLSKGKRGIVCLREWDGRTIAVKTKNPLSTAPARIDIEAQFLNKVNKHGIGPTFYFFADGELGMEYIKGELFEEFLPRHPKQDIRAVLMDLIDQLFQLDQLGITKEEMHHPTKHIIVRSGKPVLIDFERCRFTEKPKNVTQLVQYLTSSRLSAQLREKGFSLTGLRKWARTYEYSPLQIEELKKRIS